MADNKHPDPGPPSLIARIGKDLLPRVVSALVLLVVVGAITWIGGLPSRCS